MRQDEILFIAMLPELRVRVPIFKSYGFVVGLTPRLDLGFKYAEFYYGTLGSPMSHLPNHVKHKPLDLQRDGWGCKDSVVLEKLGTIRVWTHPGDGQKLEFVPLKGGEDLAEELENFPVENYHVGIGSDPGHPDIFQNR